MHSSRGILQSPAARSGRERAAAAVIDRLRSTVRALGTLRADEIGRPEHEALRRDCADSVRLQLDCMQADLVASERYAFERLHLLLEEPGAPGSEILAAVRAVAAVID